MSLKIRVFIRPMHILAIAWMQAQAKLWHGQQRQPESSLGAQRQARRHQREAEDAQADLEADEHQILRQLGEKVLAVALRYAHENGYTMMVNVGANGQRPTANSQQPTANSQTT